MLAMADLGRYRMAEMFESATWTRRNRRVFAIIRELKRTVDREYSGPLDRSDEPAVAAAVCKQVGAYLFLGSVVAAAGSRRHERSAWKHVSAEEGARAAVVLTLAVAELVRLEEEYRFFDPTILEIDRIVRTEFSPSSTEIRILEETLDKLRLELSSELTQMATENGGTAAHDLVLACQAALSAQALELGGISLAKTPKLTLLANSGVDSWPYIRNFEWLTLTNSGFNPFWRRAREALLDMVLEMSEDPSDGIRRNMLKSPLQESEMVALPVSDLPADQDISELGTSVTVFESLDGTPGPFIFVNVTELNNRLVDEIESGHLDDDDREGAHRFLADEMNDPELWMDSDQEYPDDIEWSAFRFDPQTARVVMDS